MSLTVHLGDTDGSFVGAETDAFRPDRGSVGYASPSESRRGIVHGDPCTGISVYGIRKLT